MGGSRRMESMFCLSRLTAGRRHRSILRTGTRPEGKMGTPKQLTHEYGGGWRGVVLGLEADSVCLAGVSGVQR
jgi:hypothetical protein